MKKSNAQTLTSCSIELFEITDNAIFLNGTAKS